VGGRGDGHCGTGSPSLVGRLYKDKTKAGRYDALSIQGTDYRDQYTRRASRSTSGKNWIYGSRKR